jgi:hypothetical protein
MYWPRRAASVLRLRGVSGEESAIRSRHLLDASARVRRTCPKCQGMYPTLGVWAARLRCRLNREGKVDHGT